MPFLRYSSVLILGISKSEGDPPPLHKKILGNDFMIKFKLMKNTFSVYLDIFNSGLLLISDQFLLKIVLPNKNKLQT